MIRGKLRDGPGAQRQRSDLKMTSKCFLSQLNVTKIFPRFPQTLSFFLPYLRVFTSRGVTLFLRNTDSMADTLQQFELQTIFGRLGFVTGSPLMMPVLG